MPNKKNEAARWRHFSNSPFAIYQSLHREVTIGVLSVAMLSAVALKAKAQTNFAPEIADLTPEDSLSSALLDEVEVLASRVPLSGILAPRLVTVLSSADIAAAAVQSINDLLEFAVGIDVRQRGEMGVQTDISVRGGTFDQITILINGVNITSPQTGHHSADFPVSVQDIVRIEILEGPCARVFGTSAFTGVLNIVTRTDSGCSARLTCGDYGYASGDLRLATAHKHYSQNLSGGYSRSDGATPNSDFGMSRTFYNGVLTKDSLRINLQAGYSYRKYGANTFYGAASTDQWECLQKYLGSVSFENKIGNRLHLSASANWNRWYDHYQWHKGKPAGENYHRVDAVSATFNIWTDSPLGRTSLGLETRYEAISSTKLGEDVSESSDKYGKFADRTNYSAFVEHTFSSQHWTLSLGTLATINTQHSTLFRLYPGIDASYQPNSACRLYASWNMALRMPTFTDLYYSGTNIVGTSDLRPEQTNDISTGVRLRKPGWKTEVSAFYSHKKDLIDWVIYADEPDGSTFRSGNFKLNNIGLELSASILPQEIIQHFLIRKFSLQYAYINEEIHYAQPILASKYAMEYLRHKVVASLDTQLFSHLSLSLSWRWQDRVGINNNPYSLLDGKLNWNSKNWAIWIECSNIYNKEYYDFSYIPQPGRWMKAGIDIRF